ARRGDADVVDVRARRQRDRRPDAVAVAVHELALRVGMEIARARERQAAVATLHLEEAGAVKRDGERVPVLLEAALAEHPAGVHDGGSGADSHPGLDVVDEILEAGADLLV